MKLSLNGIWNGQGISPEGKTIDFDGRIPGCVHADLLRNGTIKDSFWRDNALECRWIERWNWVYEKEFSIENEEDWPQQFEWAMQITQKLIAATKPFIH